jgi:DNA adenine methylase
MGSACLFFALRPPHSLLIDLNPELVETFSAVRDYPEEIANGLSQLLRSEETYYELRSQNPSSLDIISRSIRFIYLNRYCLNGLYRTDRNGHFNVPFSQGRAGQLPSAVELLRTAAMLRHLELLCGDFEKIVTERVRPDDLFTWIHLTHSPAVVFSSSIGERSVGLQDLPRLRQMLCTLEERGAFFVLSYASCDEILEQCQGWTICRVQTTRNVAGFARYRRRDEELIITNIVRTAA